MINCLHIFNHFVSFHLDLVECEDRNGTAFIRPVKKIHSIVELSYYSNSLAAHFALDAVVMCSLLKMAPKSENDSNSNSVSVKYCHLFSVLLFISNRQLHQRLIIYSNFNRNLPLAKAILFNCVNNTVIYFDMTFCSTNRVKSSTIYSKTQSIA